MNLFSRLKADCSEAWTAYTDHSFVRSMGDGTLAREAFQHYLVQDYLFLIQFSRAYALAVYKSRTVEDMRASLEGLKAILEVEMKLHVQLCADCGLSERDLQDAPEARATIAYTRFVLDAGAAGDLLDMKVALAPCMIGYGEIGKNLAGKLRPSNPYAVWINEYAGADYQDLMHNTIADLDREASHSFTEHRYRDLRKLFEAATWLEADFWQMGLDRSL
ncbi:MAG: thiaminase II [Pseudomonadota bacterium]